MRIYTYFLRTRTARLLAVAASCMLLLQGCPDDTGGNTGGNETPAQPFRVTGRFLTDPCGDTVVLKGINKMSVFDETDPYGTNYFPEIAKTKANCVRIVWQTVYSNGTPTRLGQLDTLIQNCLAQRMIPMVEMHDATCDLSRLNIAVDYWTRPDVVQLVQRYEHALLVNIANEAGNDGVTETAFLQAYQDAITRMRNAGIHTPLVIDGTACGKNMDILVATAAQLTQHDPEHNLLFSVHTYWSNVAIQQAGNPNFIADQLQKAATANVPLIIGELCAFGGWPGNNNQIEICSPNGAVDYQTLLTECNRQQMGWLAWEWGPGNGFYEYNPPVLCPQMDMTTDGTYNSILAITASSPNAWVKDAVIDHPYGMEKSAGKTAYVQNGFRCGDGE